MRANHGADKPHPFVIILKIYLVWVKLQPQPGTQKNFYLPPRLKQNILVPVKQNKVINIAAVVSDAKFFRDVLIQTIEVKIGKYLRCQVAYGQTAVFVRPEQTFIIRQTVPVRQMSLDDTIIFGIMHDYLLYQPQQNPFVRCVVSGVDKICRHPA